MADVRSIFHVFCIALAGFACSLLLRATTMAAETVPSDAVRFSRHVVPMLSKLGCNAGACHGMVQGKGGFRLSLFGVDPAADHHVLTREAAGRRVNRLVPEASLFLRKATGQIPHGGGKRLAVDSDDYRLLRAWVAQGAALDDIEQSLVQSFTITPGSKDVRPGEEFSLAVEAVYADGSKHDVTALCRFEVRDAEVATVNEQGRVKALRVGDTALLVRYPGQVGIGTLIVMPEQPAADFPDVAGHNFIDEHVLARLRLLGLKPAPLCDDATFLRRVTLDVNGRLPEPEEVRAFVADATPNKRAAVVDALLARPDYAALWATKLMDTLRITGFTNPTFPPVVDDHYRGFKWLEARLKEDIPYDELAERIILATSREGRSYEAWADEVAAVSTEEAEKKEPATYASRQTLDLFWQRRMGTTVDHGVRIGHSFLGLRLQCAQCHRHPHDVWTQDDLLSFSNFFMRVPHFSSLGGPKAKPTGDVEKLAKARTDKLPKGAQGAFKRLFGGPEVYVLTEADIAGPGMQGGRSYFAGSSTGFATVTSPLGTQSAETMRFLGEDKPLENPPVDTDRRKLVVEWLRRPDNPYFAKAMANRVWAHYMGRGIVDPPDDLSPLNPPSHPELLAELAGGFIEHKFDLKWLHRTIIASRTYQQSSTPVAGSEHDRQNYAAFSIRRLPAEILLDITDQAAGVKPDYAPRKGAGTPPGTRLLAGAAIFLRGDSPDAFALTTFGRPERDIEVVCDCERQDHATMLQALYLANHPDMRKKIADPQGRAAAIAKNLSDTGEQITEVYLCTASRLPREEELQICHEYLKKFDNPQKGLEGLLWTLINSNDFLFNQ